MQNCLPQKPHSHDPVVQNLLTLSHKWCKTILHYLTNEAHIVSRAEMHNVLAQKLEAHNAFIDAKLFSQLTKWLEYYNACNEALMPNYFQNLTKWLEAHNARDPLMQNYRWVNLPRKPRTKKPVAVRGSLFCTLYNEVCAVRARFLLCIYYEIIISYYDCASGG